MGAVRGEAEEGGATPTCPSGHPVGDRDVFCPVCLELVTRSPGAFWTVNDARDRPHPSEEAESLDQGPAVRPERG